MFTMLMGCLLLQSLETVLLFGMTYAYGRAEITHPKIQPVYIKTGDTLELICEHDDGFSLEWFKSPISSNPSSVTESTSHGHSRKFVKIDTSSGSGFLMVSNLKEGRFWTNLTKVNVTVEDTAAYQCSLVSRPDKFYIVDVTVVEANEIPAIVNLTKVEAGVNIGCTVTIPDQLPVKINWLKSGKPFEGNNSNYQVRRNRTETHVTSFINITRVGEQDIGPFYCVISLENGVNLTQVVNLYSYPMIKSMGRSSNIVIGSRLELACRFTGWPTPQVTWQRDGTPGALLGANDTRVSFQPEYAVAPHDILVANATLLITNVSYADRDIYRCFISSFVNGTIHHGNGSVVVRIKGKFAVLWPLVGIILEAVILFVIIFVHETIQRKNKAKAEAKELSANHLDRTVDAPHGGHQLNDTMRHRKK